MLSNIKGLWSLLKPDLGDSSWFSRRWVKKKDPSRILFPTTGGKCDSRCPSCKAPPPSADFKITSRPAAKNKRWLAVRIRIKLRPLFARNPRPLPSHKKHWGAKPRGDRIWYPSHYHILSSPFKSHLLESLKWKQFLCALRMAIGYAGVAYIVSAPLGMVLPEKSHLHLLTFALVLCKL